MQKSNIFTFFPLQLVSVGDSECWTAHVAIGLHQGASISLLNHCCRHSLPVRTLAKVCQAALSTHRCDKSFFGGKKEYRRKRLALGAGKIKYGKTAVNGLDEAYFTLSEWKGLQRAFTN